MLLHSAIDLLAYMHIVWYVVNNYTTDIAWSGLKHQVPYHMHVYHLLRIQLYYVVRNFQNALHCWYQMPSQ